LIPQNLLILISDEHNATMMGRTGHPLAKTPNLDALAARGTRFVTTTCPISCLPALCPPHRILGQFASPMTAVCRTGATAAGIRVESVGKLHYRLEDDPTGFDKKHIPMYIVGMIQLSIRRQFPDFVPLAMRD
jgi:choline-sulfatase